MQENSVLGLIFSNTNEELIRELTDKRAMGSVPFGGRYRLIDFILSNMVNSGIKKVGVITKHNYQSLMDHLGSGKTWDLSRKRGGLYILPPFGNGSREFNNRLETLYALGGFLGHAKEKYVLISDCDVVCNIDYQDVLKNHIKSNADMTVIYKHGYIPKKLKEPLVLSLGVDNTVKDVLINPRMEDECNYGLNMFLMKRELLIRLISECMSKNETSFKRDIIQKNVNNLKICGYEFCGYSQMITSMNSYFEANMALMQEKVRNELFNSNKPIYTKVRDDMPTRYGMNADIKNSLIANGCIIDGTVENSVIFRGVNIGKGAKVSNSVLMQDTIIGAGCTLDHVIADKDVIIKGDRRLIGFVSYPIYISKASTV